MPKKAFCPCPVEKSGLSDEIISPINETLTITIKDILDQNELKIIIKTSKILFKNDILTNTIYKQIGEQIKIQKNPLKLDISFLEAPQPDGDNYVAVKQNTDEWHTARKFKITGSPLPSLLGLKNSIATGK